MVKFTNKIANQTEKETQTHGSYIECQDRVLYPRVHNNDENLDENMGNASGQTVKGDISEVEGEEPSTERVTRENPPRARRKPA